MFLIMMMIDTFIHALIQYYSTPNFNKTLIDNWLFTCKCKDLGSENLLSGNQIVKILRVFGINDVTTSGWGVSKDIVTIVLKP